MESHRAQLLPLLSRTGVGNREEFPTARTRDLWPLGISSSPRQAGRGQHEAVWLGGVMLAQGEAFAIKNGVPAKATAHAVHFAVQIPAAVRARIEQFILLAVGFEIGHADASQPYGHAPREQFGEQVLGDDEQFALVVGGFAEPLRPVYGKMVDITEAQAEGARPLAVFAQGRADALAEILDQAGEKLRINGAAFNGGFAGDGLRRGREEHLAAVESAGALPDLLADGFAEGRLQSSLRHAAQLADGGDAAFGQRAGVQVSDAVELLDR